MINVLLLEGRARQVLPMSKSLRKLGCEVTTLNSSKLDPGYASKYPHRKLLTFFDPKFPEKSFKSLKKELEEYHYDLIIPLNDDAAILLAKNKEEIENLSKIACNDWPVFKMASDKLNTMLICKTLQIPSPYTYESLEKFLQDNENTKYPVVIKPRTGCAAVGFHIAKDENDVMAYIKEAEKKFGPMLIQEFIPQDGLQYKAQLYINRDGVLKGACVFSKVRWYPLNGGSSTLNETVERPDIIEDCLKLLKGINWKGYADIDLIEDSRDGKIKIMEINPRITGSVKICFESGIDFSKLIIDDLKGIDSTPQLSAKHKFMRYLHTDILWFIKSPNRFKISPSWFNFRNSCDQIFDWRDPWVFLTYTLQAFSKLKNDKKKRNFNVNN